MSFMESAGSFLRVERESVTYGDQQAESLRRELEAGHWQSAADFLGLLRDWDDRDFYVQALSQWPGRPLWLDDWVQQQPNSATAWLVRGVHTKNWAWEARGSGLADTVSEKGFKLFFERLARAEEELLRAAELDPADPTPWAHLVMVGVGAQKSLDKIQEWFQQAVRRHSRHATAHYSMLQALCAKWYGSHDQMFDFARGTCAKLPNGHGLHALIALAHFERVAAMYREQQTLSATGYYRRQEVAEEINQSAERSILSPCIERRVALRRSATFLRTRCMPWDSARMRSSNSAAWVLGSRILGPARKNSWWRGETAVRRSCKSAQFRFTASTWSAQVWRP